MAVIETRKRGGGGTAYRVKIRIKGYPPQTDTFDRLTDAKRWAKTTEAAIWEGRYSKNVEAKKHTLADLIDRYIQTHLPSKPKSEKKQKAQLLWWKKKVGPYLLVDVTPPLIAECRDALRTEPFRKDRLRCQSTVNRYLAALSHAFTIAGDEWHWVDSNPVLKVKKGKEHPGRIRFLSDEERMALLDACKKSRNPYLYAVVVTAISTGMRRFTEILTLKRKQIDLANSRILLTTATKNEEARSVPLVGAAKEEMKKMLKIARMHTDLVFPGPRPRKVIKPADIETAWRGAVKRAKLVDFRFHDLRHTAASYLAMEGASLPELAGVLGQKTYQMVKRYAHLAPGHNTAIVEKMNTKVFGA
jgi:integrase